MRDACASTALPRPVESAAEQVIPSDRLLSEQEVSTFPAVNYKLAPATLQRPGAVAHGGISSMSSSKATRRRVSVERNIYRRPDGRFEVGFRDTNGKQRWRVPGFPAAFDTISHARRARDAVKGMKASGERVQPSPRLKFGDAADRWLSDQVIELRPATQGIYGNAVRNHLKPRWGKRRMDSLTPDDAARLIRELRALGLSEWTISGIQKAASRVFKFARRRMGWHGTSPFELLENGERPRVSEAKERRIYTPDEFAQVVAASPEPWGTLFRLASVVGARESELLGLQWSDLTLSDIDVATIRFCHQVDRAGRRVELKTEESRAVLPLPRSVALMMLEHKARSEHSGPRSYVFATASGRPLGQRNVLRALYTAQERARTPGGITTFPELFEHDENGHLVVDRQGDFTPNRTPRRRLPPLPDFHALRHAAAMVCDDAEEARDLLRHRNSNVTRAIYRAHFSDQRREALRSRMEARMEAAAGSTSQQTAVPIRPEVLPLRGSEAIRR
jgi:integrase